MPTDTERLDWWESTGVENMNWVVRRIPGDPDNPAEAQIQPHYPHMDISFGYRSIREAIDAAMEAENAD